MIYIVGVKLLEYITDYFFQVLTNNNKSVKIIYYDNLSKYINNSDDLFLLICSNVYNGKYPKNYVNLQFEQMTDKNSFWIKNQSFLNKLKNSKYIFDYSSLNLKIIKNYSYIQNNNCKLIELGTVNKYKKAESYNNNNVVFYGSMNERRYKILNTIKIELSKHNINLIIVSYNMGLYGEKLREFLRNNARLVINIHFYTNPIIEQVRIYECLSLNIPVISEKGINYNEITNFLKDNVIFVETNNTDSMVSNIIKLYNENKKYNFNYTGDCSNLINYIKDI